MVGTQFFYGAHMGLGTSVTKAQCNKAIVQASVWSGLGKLKQGTHTSARIELTATGIVISLSNPKGEQRAKGKAPRDRTIRYRDVRMVSKLPPHPASEQRPILAFTANDDTFNGDGVKALSFMFACDGQTCAKLYTETAAQVKNAKSNALARSRSRRTFRGKDKPQNLDLEQLTAATTRSSGGGTRRASMAHTAWMQQHGFEATHPSTGTGTGTDRAKYPLPADLFDHCFVHANGEETWSF